MFRRSRLIVAVAVSSLTFSVIAFAALESLGSANYQVEAAAKPKIGPRLEFDGKGPATAKEEGGKLVFKADLKKLDMGNRTSHMKEDFEVSKHPTVTLSIDKSKLKMPDDKKKESDTVTGELELHGKKKPVKVKYSVARTGSDYHIKNATFSFKYTDFGIKEICRFKGTICVEPSVTIKVPQMKLRDK